MLIVICANWIILPFSFPKQYFFWITRQLLICLSQYYADYSRKITSPKSKVEKLSALFNY